MWALSTISSHSDSLWLLLRVGLDSARLDNISAMQKDSPTLNKSLELFWKQILLKEAGKGNWSVGFCPVNTKRENHHWKNTEKNYIYSCRTFTHFTAVLYCGLWLVWHQGRFWHHTVTDTRTKQKARGKNTTPRKRTSPDWTGPSPFRGMKGPKHRG